MGAESSKQGLHQAINRTASRAGKIAVSGRYHKLPKKLEDDYQVESTVLGKGYNGSVFMAKSKTTKEKFAVKAFKLHGVKAEKKEELATECEIFLGMDHPHVARLVDVYEGEDQLTLVMECMTGGELFNRVTERKRFNERDAAEAVNMMLLAINYIHSHSIVHRDLKLENFLYETKESDHLKLIDFGFSKVWKKNTKMDLSCGTLAYVAPEVLEKDYTSQCDMWSLGVIVFILLVGYMPFSGSESVQMKSIKAGKYMIKKEKWDNVSDKAASFVRALLVVNPDERLTAEKALEHPFVKEREKVMRSDSQMDQSMVDALTNYGQASAFRRAAMNVMAWSLTNEERKSVRNAFLALDVDRTGCVKLWEFKKVLLEQFHIADQQAVDIFHALDSGHHDEVHYSEFLAAMCSTRIALHDDLLKLTFRRFDTDNSGFITIENLKEVLGGDNYEGVDVNQMLKEADVGQDGKISLEDFVNYMRHPEIHAHHLDAATNIIDQGVKKGDKVVEPSARKRTDGTADTKDVPIDVDTKANGGDKPKPKCCAIL